MQGRQSNEVVTAVSDDNVPLLQSRELFAVATKFMSTASLFALSQTCSRAKLLANQINMNNPVAILWMLGHSSRIEAAKFFRKHSQLLEGKVELWLSVNPENHAAYVLYALMARIDKIDQARLDACCEYLDRKQFPVTLRHSLQFISEFINHPTNLRLNLKKFKGCYLNLHGANLEQVDLESTSRKKALDLSGVDLRNANLAEAMFSNANLEYANLDNAMLSGALFANARMLGATLCGALIEPDFGNTAGLMFYDASFFPKTARNDEQFGKKPYIAAHKAAVKKALNFYGSLKSLPDNLAQAMCSDYVKAIGSESCYGETGPTDLAVARKKKRLNAGMRHPLFANHSDCLLEFIDRRIIKLNTQSQKVLLRDLTNLDQVAAARRRK